MGKEQFQARKVKSKAEWGKLKAHEIVLPSGAAVTIEIPNLPELIEADQLPNNLVDTAIEVAQGKEVTAEHIKDQADFYRHLVLLTVKSPDDLVEADLKPGGPVPYEDVELIAEIATRQRDVDALGNHIGGLHKSADWRQFRGLETID